MLTRSVSENHLELETEDLREILRLMAMDDLEFDDDCPVVKVSLIFVRAPLTSAQRDAKVKAAIKTRVDHELNDDQTNLF